MLYIIYNIYVAFVCFCFMSDGDVSIIFISCHRTLGWDLQAGLTDDLWPWTLLAARLDTGTCAHLTCGCATRGDWTASLVSFKEKPIATKQKFHKCETSHVLVDKEAKLDEIHHNSPMFFKKMAIRGTILRYPFLILFGHRGICLRHIIQHQDWCIHNHQRRRW